MAPPPNPKTHNSVQELFNLSFDKDKGVLALELLGYYASGNTLVRLAVDSNGVVQTNAGSTYVPQTRTLEMIGTTNQVTVSPTGAQSLAANRAWTFSLPQSIDTAALVSFGTATLSQNNIVTTTTPALTLQNTTASTSGVPVQYSPGIDFIGHGFRTLAADRTVRFREEMRPVSGSSPSGTMAWMSSVDTGTAAWTDRMTLTSAGALSVASLTASSLTSGRVPIVSTAGLLIDDANLLFSTSTDELSLVASGSSAGLLLGTDVKLYRRTTDIGALASGDSFEVPGNMAIGTTTTAASTTYMNVVKTSTATSGNSIGYDSTITANPAGASSGRYYGFRLTAVVQSGNAQNFTDGTGGISGFEGNAQHNGTGTVTQMIPVISFSSLGSTGSATSVIGGDFYGVDASSGGTVTTFMATQHRQPRLSGNGLVTTAYGSFVTARTVSTGAALSGLHGDITNWVGYRVNTVNVYTANNQKRTGLEVSTLPNPASSAGGEYPAGPYTGTTTAAVWLGFDSTPTTSRDGIWWGSGLDFGMFRTGSAAGQITGALTITGNVTHSAANLITDTTTGMKIATATTQKLGFFNSTPIVQPSGTGETVGFTAGAGTNVTDASTFTGNVGSTAYRISDIVKALKNLGLIAA